MYCIQLEQLWLSCLRKRQRFAHGLAEEVPLLSAVLSGIAQLVHKCFIIQLPSLPMLVSLLFLLLLTDRISPKMIAQTGNMAPFIMAPSVPKTTIHHSGALSAISLTRGTFFNSLSHSACQSCWEEPKRGKIKNQISVCF